MAKTVHFTHKQKFEDELLRALELLKKGQARQLIHRPPQTVMLCAPTNKAVQTLVSSFVRDGWTKNELVVVGSQHTVMPEILEYCLDYRLDRFRKLKKEIDDTEDGPERRAKESKYRYLHRQLTGVVSATQSFVCYLLTVTRKHAEFYKVESLQRIVALFLNLPRRESRLPTKPKPTPHMLLSNARVVACTVTNAARYAMRKLETPTIIMDEAAQCQEAESLIVASHDGLQRLVMVGDPKQLPALVIS